MNLSFCIRKSEIFRLQEGLIHLAIVVNITSGWIGLAMWSFMPTDRTLSILCYNPYQLNTKSC